MKTVIFISSHPIQYFAPLYQSLQQEGVPVKVYYCSRHGMDGQADREFATSVKWDIPLLSGYEHEFLKNYFTQPSVYRFFGLINLGIIRRLAKAPRSVVVIHGWNYATNILAMIAARIFGHTVCLRAETPYCHEIKRSPKKKKIRQFLLRRLLFPWFHYFLYIGRQNKAFYKLYAVDDKKLLFTPYAVDNDRFSAAAAELAPHRNALRAELGIPDGAVMILFSGKYIDKKRPLDLLEAFLQLKAKFSSVYLYMMGEGALRGQMEEFIRRHRLTGVVLTGFVNQQAIPRYYAAADIFVMCSTIGETWGLSVNEAMNFGLPLVLSDLTGSADDLVSEGRNGYVFETGNIHTLAEKLEKLLLYNKEKLKEAGRTSAEIVRGYSFRQIGTALRQII